MADPGAGGVVRREAGVPRAALWLSLCLLCPFHYMASSKHAGEQRGPRASGWVGGGGGAAVSFSIRAKKSDKDNKRTGEVGGINKNKGTRFLRKVEGRVGRSDKAI